MGGVAKTEVSDDLRIGWPQQGLKDMTSMSGLRQGFPKENGLTAVIRHAWCDERAADCLRFASPAEATGGLEALRLGGKEFGATNCSASSFVHLSFYYLSIYL